MKNPTKDTQSGLEELFSKHQLLPVLRAEFLAFIQEEIEVVEADFAAEALSQIYLHRQTDVPTLVGILTGRFGTPQEVADKLLLMVEADYLDFEEVNQKFIVKFHVSADVQDMLDRYQYPLPMITKPNMLKSNYDTGYETITGSCVLNGSEYFQDKDMCLDHLNRANSVALCISQETVTSDEGKYIRPTRNQGEDFGEFRKRQKQADVFYATSLDVMATITGLSDVLYMTHKYDRRGRTYCSGYHVSPQGDDYRKAVLHLSKKEIINGTQSTDPSEAL